MAVDDQYRQQVALLMKTLPSVATEVEFALKGGTAINLFVRDLPRLSVDIDLTYLPVLPREDSLRRIEDALKRIGDGVVRSVPGVRVQESRLGGEGSLNRLLIRSRTTQIKIEVTPVTRGCVFEPTVMQVTETVEEEFGFAETNVVSFDDLYAGKLVAALDRQHPRDLFDVRDLLAKEGITDGLRRAFLVYVASHNRPANEVLSPKRKDIRHAYDNHFVGMTKEAISLDALLETREEMIRQTVGQMPRDHRNLLIGIERGEADWTSVGLENVADLPAIRWKHRNLDKVPEARREAFAATLTAVWE